MYKTLLSLILVLFYFPTYSQKIIDSVSTEKELKEIFLIAKDPISVKFSVKKLSKIDIYLSPISNADPLKAISILPASTDIEETANPSLRGAFPDRTRVYLNGSPIINPVKFGRDNGLGNFSLFNTEIIDKQYVYSSNPPLTYGNSSAGLVQIETNENLKEEGTQLSLTLSNIGIMLNKKFSHNNFFQFYGNYQFDNFFIKLNKKKVENLNSFSTIDFGANIHLNITQNLSFNSFNYFISEKYSSVNNLLNFSSNSINHKKRFFSVNNLDYNLKKTRIRYSTMFDYRDSNFEYGNILSNSINTQYFNSIGATTKFNKTITAQYGIETAVYNNKYNETLPVYYFAISSISPTITNKQNINFHYIEPYIYLNFELFENFGFSSAIRKNMFWSSNSKNFISYQLSSHYEPNHKNRFIISGGRYHSYTSPNYYIRDYSLLSSKQLALDYYFDSDKFNLFSALYYKNDSGDLRLNNYEKYDKVETFGFEISADLPLYRYFKFNISNSYVNQKQFLSGIKYNTAFNLKYFIKGQITYNNPKLFNCSILFTTRPGNNYTSFSGAFFNSQANDFEPIYTNLFSNTFSNYQRLDFSISKLVALKKSYLIVFASINNILDHKNESSPFYNTDYTSSFFNYFQRRIFHFGVQLRF